MTNAPRGIILAAGCLRWLQPEDLPFFAEMNADPQVMEHFPRALSFEESRIAFEKIQDEFAARGFGLYALESEGEFAGIVGLWVPSFEAYFTPAVEILWRLRPPFWGRGLATEAARAVLHLAFRTLELPEVVAFAVEENQRSVRVMERAGMKRDSFFDHPDVTEARLRRHVLYKATPHSKNV